MEISAPFDGKIKEFYVKDGQQVEQHALVCSFVEDSASSAETLPPSQDDAPANIDESKLSAVNKVESEKVPENNESIKQNTTSSIAEKSFEIGKENLNANNRSQTVTRMTRIRSKIAERLKGNWYSLGCWLENASQGEKSHLRDFRRF